MSTNNNTANDVSSGKATGNRYYTFLSDSEFSPSILYIEDNYSHIHLVKRILEIIPSLRFYSATTAEEGLKLAITEKPDLVILDMRMPVIDGYEILENLKIHPLTRHIPVIALSASAMIHEVEKGMSMGLQRYLTKPINIKEFLVSVKEELDQLYLLRNA